MIMNFKSFNESKNIVVPDYLYNLLPLEFYKKIGHGNIVGTVGKNAYANHNRYKTYIPLNQIADNYDSKAVYIHELSHKFHYKLRIITNNYCDNKFINIYNNFIEEFNLLDEKTKLIFKVRNQREFDISFFKLEELVKFTNLHDKLVNFLYLIQAITYNEYGYGSQSDNYFDNIYARYRELFATLMSNLFLKNELIYYYFPKSVKIANKYLKNLVYK